MSTLINGQHIDSVSALDRGLLFGDGLFETLAFMDGHCPLWDRHMDRLRRGAEILRIEAPERGRLKDECRELAGARGKRVIRLTLTRGTGGRGYWPDAGAPSTRIVQRRDWPTGLDDAHRSGLKAITSTVQLASQRLLSGLKHCNRLEQILAAQECQARGADEAVLFDQDGRVAEAISSNLLLRIGGQWRAPQSPSAVAGVGLAWLSETSPLGVCRASIDATDLDQADAILVINSVAGVRPLRQLDERELIIDEDCRQLQRHWNQTLIPPCDDC